LWNAGRLAPGSGGLINGLFAVSGNHGHPRLVGPARPKSSPQAGDADDGHPPAIRNVLFLAAPTAVKLMRSPTSVIRRQVRSIF